MSPETSNFRCYSIALFASLASIAVLAFPQPVRCGIRVDHYDVHVKLDSPDSNRFQVTSQASGVISAGSDAILLDYEGGSVDSLSVVLDGVKYQNPSWHLRNGHLAIKLASPLISDTPAEVTTSTTASYSEPKGEGLVKYQDKDGVLYSTQFEPAAARKVFPVVDRPDAFAKFRFSIQCRSSCRAFSNSSSLPTQRDSTLIEFQSTPALSPHLAAFIAGDVERSKAIKAGRRQVEVALVSPKGYQKYASKVLGLSKQVIEDFEAQGLVLPNDKVDLVLVPQFRYYGMENPGILFFRAELVSWAANGNHWDDLKQLIAHEFAHQWFGNILAPSRWRDVWISESFATWAAERIVPTDGDQSVDLVDQIRGIGLPVVSNYPQVESSPRSIFASSRYGRGARILKAVFSRDVTLGAVLDGLLAGDDRAYLDTGQLLDRLDKSGLSSVDIPALRRALNTVSPDPVAVALVKHEGQTLKPPRVDEPTCVGVYIPEPSMYPLRVWTYMNKASYTRALNCIDDDSEAKTSGARYQCF